MSEAINGRIQPAQAIRAIFNNLVTGRKFEQRGKEVGDLRYDATFVIDAETLKPIAAKAVEIARAKWPGIDPKELHWPWTPKVKAVETAGKRAAKNGKDPEAAKAKLAALIPDGSFVLKASSKFEPQLAFLDNKGKIVEYTSATRVTAKNKFYGGAFLVPQFNLVAYVAKEVDDPDGVTAYIDQALWYKDGEKIGGAPPAAEAFKSYAGKVTNEDPTAGGLDDEIPF